MRTYSDKFLINKSFELSMIPFNRIEDEDLKEVGNLNLPSLLVELNYRLISFIEAFDKPGAESKQMMSLLFFYKKLLIFSPQNQQIKFLIFWKFLVEVSQFCSNKLFLSC